MEPEERLTLEIILLKVLQLEAPETMPFTVQIAMSITFRYEPQLSRKAPDQQQQRRPTVIQLIW
jgi:hypothetical protein